MRIEMRFYSFFGIISFIISSYTIMVFLNYWQLPLLLILFGFFTYLFNANKSIHLYVFFLPLLGALPSLNKTGYAYNLMALPLFYLSGIMLAGLIKEKKIEVRGIWIKYYLWFLVIIWISVLFVILKWSNISFGFNTLFRDTQVTPQGIRVSFSIIYPVITLFLFSVSPFIGFFITIRKVSKEKIMLSLTGGFLISVTVSIFQNFFSSSFMSAPIPFFWKDKPQQFNGGFSDFNAFGFFSGIIFLYYFIVLLESLFGKNKNAQKSLLSILGIIVALSGIYFSGSRTALFCVIFGLFYLIFNRNISVKNKGIFVFIMIIVFLLFGGIVKKRIVDSFENLSNKKSILDIVDKVSNGRIQMIKNSVPMIKRFPVSGVGSGNFLFYLQYLKYGEKFYQDLPLNQYLLILTETGVIGLFAFLLFLFSALFGKNRGVFFIILFAVSITFLFGNSLWISECIILFFILVAFNVNKNGKVIKFKNQNIFIYSILFLFVASNILSFSKLNPKNLIYEKNIVYKYGFYCDSGEKKFLWTKGEAGIYVKLDKLGKSRKYRIFCGAPVYRLPGKRQEVIVYWKGKEYKRFVFKENKEQFFIIKGEKNDEGFLKIVTIPTFNLKKMGLGDETRNLGVQFYF